MSKTEEVHWQRKHTWAAIDRAEPPKRSAEDRLADFFEVYSSFDEQTAREQASRCLQCPEPSCVKACPLHNRIPEWLAYTAEGRFLEAAMLSCSTSNMPEICSRVCPQERLCEGSCFLNGKAEPVSIGAIERFINEHALRVGLPLVSQAPPNGMHVAVIGSGPGGLAAADELALRGYHVTVFESHMIPGGLLVNGIPAFKLEKTIVARRIEILKQRGVEFRLGLTLGKDLSLQGLLDSHDAVFLAFGAQQSRPLQLPGENLPGVYQALPFLIQKNLDCNVLDIPPIEVEGKRVVVLGGGDTAMDCLRTALRCGAKSAWCLYRRDLDQMPGNRREYLNALEEGAEFWFLSNPLAIEAGPDGNAARVRCGRMILGPAAQPEGRPRPLPIPGSEFSVDADVVIGAFGFEPVRFPDDADLARLESNSGGGLRVDENQMTNIPGVFAGGDAVHGPSLVAHAVRDARKAAQGIDRFLQQRQSLPA